MRRREARVAQAQPSQFRRLARAERTRRRDAANRGEKISPCQIIAMSATVAHDSLERLAGWLDASLAKFKAHQAENASVTPDAYVLDDARGSSFVDAERTLADRILAARVAKEKAYADRVTAEDEARLERERLEHEAAMEAAAEAARNLKICLLYTSPSPRD